MHEYAVLVVTSAGAFHALSIVSSKLRGVFWMQFASELQMRCQVHLDLCA